MFRPGILAQTGEAKSIFVDPSRVPLAAVTGLEDMDMSCF